MVSRRHGRTESSAGYAATPFLGALGALLSRSAIDRRLTACLVVAVALAGVFAQSASARWTHISLKPSKTEPYFGCSPHPQANHFSCAIVIDPAPKKAVRGHVPAGADGAASPALLGEGIGGGFDPADLRSIYGLPSTSAGSGQTIGIVDAYDDPNAEADLAKYRAGYAGIPPCTIANGCFRKVNQTGGTSYPQPAKIGTEGKLGWGGEISLDLDMVSAICPNCHILLVEANDNTGLNLYEAENEAAALGATEISNSWYTPEAGNDTLFDPYFDHPGIPTAVASGDNGYEVTYPASSPDVIAVGGTTVSKASNFRGWAESVWSGTGSGCSAHEPKPSWQKDSGCGNRTNNDVAAVADVNTPVSIYDGYDFPTSPWEAAGGTSAATPIVAGAMALAGPYTRSLPGAEAFYLQALQNGAGTLDDVLSGSDGSCGSGNYLCNAGPGYDGPTGLGSPYGTPVAAQILPSATTESATEIREVGATLNASVNPNGPETEYYFQYGESQNYGSSTPVGHAGFGSGAKTVNHATGVLVPGRTYHYRIVASSVAGTSYGSDRVFTTPSSVPAAVVASNGTEYVYFRGENGAIWQANGAGGAVIELGGEALNDPTAVALPSGEQDVYFRGKNNALWRLYLNPATESWSLKELGGELAGSPSVSAKDPYVVSYQLLEGCAQCLGVTFSANNGGEWHTEWTSGAMAGDPTTVVQPSGEVQVWWVGTDGGMWYSHSSEPLRVTHTRQEAIEKWPVVSLTSQGWKPSGGKPAVVSYPSGKDAIYFNQHEGCIACDVSRFGSGTTWSPLYGTGQLAGEPVAASESETEQRAYWRGTDGAVWYNYGNPLVEPMFPERIGWSAASDLSEIYRPGASVSTSLFFLDQSGGITDLYWQTGKWHSKQVCAWPCGKQGPQPPKVTGVSPGSGSGTGGTSVTISGSSFSEVQSVKFGTTNAKSFTVHSSSSITAVAPAGIGTVDAIVTSAQGSSTSTAADNFTYTPFSTSAKPAAVLLPDGSEDVYFRGENGAIWQATSYGAVREVGGQASGNPVAVALSSGEQDVYFTGLNGAIWRLYYNPSNQQWSQSEVGGVTAGNPTVAPKQPHTVFFKQTEGCRNCIYESNLSNGVWKTRATGGSAEGDPTVVETAAGGFQVFFVETGGHGVIAELAIAKPEGEWHYSVAGGTSAAEKPAIALHADGTESVFFRAREGCINCIDQLYWNNSKWETQWVGGDSLGAPVTADEGDGTANVYWRSNGNELWDLYGKPIYPGSEWRYNNFGGHLASDPVEVHNPGASIPTSLYYIDQAGGLSDEYMQNGEWHLRQLCAWPCSAQKPLTPQFSALPQLSTQQPKQGVALTAGSGQWVGEPTIAYGYQWQDCNASGQSCTNISGATSSSYIPALGDASHTLRVLVTATNPGGASPAASNPSAVVPSLPSPVYVGSVGTTGSGGGQLLGPKGLALDGKGNTLIADEGNNRIATFSESGGFVSVFGTLGSGNAQLKSPGGEAVDSKGNIWVADTLNNRIEEFNEKAEFMRTAGFGVTNGEAKFQICTSACRVGIAGSGVGQFKEPRDIAIQSINNDVFVADTGNSRLQKFNESGEYLEAIGSAGSGNGQLKEPQALAVLWNGSVWVADTGNNRVELFNGSGGFVRTVGSLGSGNGQFKAPKGIAVDANPYVWVTDSGNNRVEVFGEAGGYLFQFGTVGTGSGQFEEPWGIQVSPGGNVFVNDTKNNRSEKWEAE
jgi:sugar lactone lactonase YvrE